MNDYNKITNPLSEFVLHISVWCINIYILIKHYIFGFANDVKNSLKSSEWQHLIDFAVPSITDALISIAYDLVTGFTRQGT